ncbi:MAG: hypothetical protein MPK62_07975, partial [Alphaproteobacteria bacterium]|nr:hypothetical protein [Alphaproteobacteria bacterium]
MCIRDRAGGASLTVNGVGSSERHQLMPAAARRKIKIVVSLIKRQTTVTGAICRPFFFLISLRAAPAGGSGCGSLERRLLIIRRRCLLMPNEVTVMPGGLVVG